jgi:wyosine [tRNA(Phe)-imidazoG37] synthetase (radical SAM superfamily)
MLVFGPVPSRRLGRSLGINHIPPKTCSYACVYCQLGRTPRMQITRQAFHSTEELVEAVGTQLAATAERGEAVDYLTFVPDGEPTLDESLGDTLGAMKAFGIPTAVISNASLIWMPEVRDALMLADWVSLKMDAGDEETWRRIDRPHGHLKLADILDGARAFAEQYRGKLVTETMLVSGVNDSEDVLMSTAKVVGGLHPNTAYLSIPTRPPAEPGVHPPDEATIAKAYAIFSGKTSPVETLTGYEGNAFAFTNDAAADILSITAVHPMREDAMTAFLTRADAGWDLVTRLIDDGQLAEINYAGHRFYLRTFKHSHT